MRTMQRGEKSKLADLTGSTQIQVGISLAGSPGTVYDISCFGLDAASKLSDDRYFIFFNQRTSPEGAITAQGAQAGDLESFAIDVSRLPGSIQRLSFTATIDGAGTMADLQSGHLRVTAGGTEVARYPLSGADFSGEKAIIIAELYLKDVWRFAAVGQGFNGGLSALLAHFGGEEAAPAAPPAAAPPAPAPPAPTPPPPPPAAAPPYQPPPPPAGAPPAPYQPPTGAPPAAPPPPAAAPAPTVNLGKVTLAKTGDQRRVSLQKGGGAPPVHVNLNWNQGGGKRRGILSGRSNAPDLDVGCMFELKDGDKGVIQPLGGNFGSRTGPPWIYLDKDDRSGAASDGENLWITRPDLIERVLVFALIYEGAADFQSVGGHMTIIGQDRSETVVNLDNPDANRTFCAIAMIAPQGDQVVITREERYFQGHRDADGFYGFGFRWTKGSK